MKSFDLQVGQRIVLAYNPTNGDGTPISPKPPLNIRHLAPIGHPDVAQAAVLPDGAVTITGIAPGTVIIWMGAQWDETDASVIPPVSIHKQVAESIHVLVEAHPASLGLSVVRPDGSAPQQQQQSQT
jgi:hypothetical protein